MVAPTPELQSLAAPYASNDPEAHFDSVRALMELVHNEFEYEPGATTATTPLPEVLGHLPGLSPGDPDRARGDGDRGVSSGTVASGEW